MTVEQIKEEAKKRFNKDITDEQAKAWLDAHGSEDLSEEELDSVAGGVFSKRLLPPIIEIPLEKQPKWLRKMLD